MEDCGYLYVKKRAGCLSYLQDPNGTKSLVTANQIIESRSMRWNVNFPEIMSYAEDATVKYCVNQYLIPIADQNQNDHIENVMELKTKQILSMLTYECVTNDKLAILPTFINIVKVSHTTTVTINPNLEMVPIRLAGIHLLSAQNVYSFCFLQPEQQLAIRKKFLNR